ncbi:MAG: hypothetical protein M1839_006761 [Geoglossum umbratile]|nr:MAG: hypothetical protein M1839_006761 [Geoglossum umbratile]
MKFIKNDTAKYDQVLLFVQFVDLMEKVSTALDENRISHYALTKRLAKKAANMMRAFQETMDSRTKRKVLVLNVADESASGANLSNMNHIIFLSPLLTETQYHYDTSTTQAIWRARRYGQKEVVHIHRFLALKTIDIDITQERTAKRLVFEGGLCDLKPEEEVDPETPSFGSWMTRREKAQSDTK